MVLFRAAGVAESRIGTPNPLAAGGGEPGADGEDCCTRLTATGSLVSDRYAPRSASFQTFRQLTCGLFGMGRITLANLPRPGVSANRRTQLSSRLSAAKWRLTRTSLRPGVECGKSKHN